MASAEHTANETLALLRAGQLQDWRNDDLFTLRALEFQGNLRYARRAAEASTWLAILPELEELTRGRGVAGPPWGVRPSTASARVATRSNTQTDASRRARRTQTAPLSTGRSPHMPRPGDATADRIRARVGRIVRPRHGR